MEMEKSKVLIMFLLNFRQSGDVLFFLNVRRLRGYTATVILLFAACSRYYIPRLIVNSTNSYLFQCLGDDTVKNNSMY